VKFLNPGQIVKIGGHNQHFDNHMIFIPFFIIVSSFLLAFWVMTKNTTKSTWVLKKIEALSAKENKSYINPFGVIKNVFFDISPTDSDELIELRKEVIGMRNENKNKTRKALLIVMGGIFIAVLITFIGAIFVRT